MHDRVGYLSFFLFFLAKNGVWMIWNSFTQALLVSKMMRWCNWTWVRKCFIVIGLLIFAMVRFKCWLYHEPIAATWVQCYKNRVVILDTDPGLLCSCVQSVPTRGITFDLHRCGFERCYHFTWCEATSKAFSLCAILAFSHMMHLCDRV